MLLQLRIKDFAIVEAADLELAEGFTVVTGETGAGKSILVNALSLVLGGRARTDLVRAGARGAEVEALFDIAEQPIIKARLEQRELVGDEPDLLLVRRVVSAQGRGKVVVNGRLSTVATLAEIVRGLVDISGQHEQQSLLIVDNHLDILDAYGQHEAARAEYREAHERLKGLRRERNRLADHEEETLRRADFIRFQIEEIERVDPQPGEVESLEAEHARLAHAEKLRSGTHLAEALLYGDDGSAFDKLGKASAEIESLARIDPELSPVGGALAAARREIEEAARHLQRYSEHVDVDPARLDEVQERIETLRRLCRKHGANVEEMLERAGALRAELEQLDDSDAHLERLARQIEQTEAETLAAAQRLSELRRQSAQRFVDAVAEELREMDLEAAVLEPHWSPVVGGGDGHVIDGIALGAVGLENLELLWSANPGEPPRPLTRIASGGELSRLMLAVKTVLCSRDLVSLYVFDEVDTGLGGRAADAIGRRIRRVAREHQALTITHLAPIAAQADQHLRVVKEPRGQRTTSRFELIAGRERAEEIARMIDGANITTATRKAAKEMLARSQ